MKCKLEYCLSSTQVRMLLHEGELFDVILIANEVVDDRGDTLVG